MNKFKNIFKKMKQDTPTQEQMDETNQTEETQAKFTESETEKDTDNQEIKAEKNDIEADNFEVKYLEANDKFLRLYSEFDNFRKRNAKERIDLIKTAGADIITSLLPIMDDFERALKAMHDAGESDAVKEGIDLIYNKLKNTLNAKGLEAMDSIGKEFDADLHEAITKIPAPDESMKGKVIDEVEKGYLLGGKVIRYAKVVVGS
jgi:molecular chaperone GrpE